LDQKDRAAELGASHVGSSEVGTSDVGHGQVGAPQVSPDEAGPSHVGTGEIRALEVRAHEVGSSEIPSAAPDLGSHEFAAPQKEGIDVSSMRRHVHVQQSISIVVGQSFGFIERESDLTVQQASRLHRQHVGEIPQQFMQVAHDGNTLNICCAVGGLRRQSCPLNVTWETFCPAPKQS